MGATGPVKFLRLKIRACPHPGTRILHTPDIRITNETQMASSPQYALSAFGGIIPAKGNEPKAATMAI